MIDYEALRALDSVIRERSFTRAAAALFITQSAISQRIKSLETMIGQPLIIRSPSIRPTAAGQQLIAHFRQVLLLEEALSGKCSHGKNAVIPVPLAVAVNTESLSTWFVGAIKKTLHEGHLLLEILAEDQEQTINLLRAGRVWGSVTSIAEAPYGCISTFLGEMTYHLVATPGFQKKYFRKRVSGSSLLDAPAAIFGGKDEMHKNYLRKLFRAYAKGTPNLHHVPSAEGIVQFAVEGLAFALLPEVAIDSHLKNGRLVNLLPTRPYKLPLYWQTQELQTETTREFSEHIVSYARAALG